MHIRNTLSLEDVEVSQPCLDTLKPANPFQMVGQPYDLKFDADGNIGGIR